MNDILQKEEISRFIKSQRTHFCGHIEHLEDSRMSKRIWNAQVYNTR